MLGPEACATRIRSDKRESEFHLLPRLGDESSKSKPRLTDGETEACSVDGQVLGIGDTKTR